MSRLTEVVFVEPLAVRVPTAAEMLGVAVCTMYKIIRQGGVETIELPGCADTRVTVASLRELARKRPAAKHARPRVARK